MSIGAALGAVAKQALVAAVGKKITQTVNKVVDGEHTDEKEEVEVVKVHAAKAGGWVASVGGAVVTYLVATNKIDPELGQLAREIIAIVAPGVADALQAIAFPEALPAPSPKQ